MNTKKHHVVVIGAGYIGLEVAAIAAKNNGVEVRTYNVIYHETD